MSGIQLHCQPARDGNMLLFKYRITNLGTDDAYVMHALADVAADGALFANEDAAVVVLGPDQIAVVGKFLAPLPADRRMARRAVPLARHVAPGESFETCLNIPMPLAETSPYYGELRLRQYEPVELAGTSFRLGVWRGGNAGLAARPVAYAEDLFEILSRTEEVTPDYVTQHFPTKGLQILKRAGLFSRPVAS